MTISSLEAFAMAEIDIVRLDENPRETSFGVRADTSSRGVDLEGAQITVTYADGTSETLIWKALDPYTNGGASGEHINMFFGYSWHELSTTKTVVSLQIDLAPANSVFDTTFPLDNDPDEPSTPGSQNGFPFKLSPDYEDISGSITATYTGIVNLEGSPAAGDLYTTMTVDFSGLPGGGLDGDLVWNSDIDTMTGPFKAALTAKDDTVEISGNGSEAFDILGNDLPGANGSLTISHINGQVVSSGDTVTLASGETVTLNADGTISLINDGGADETNAFTYTVADGLGNSSTGKVTVTTKVPAPPCFTAGTMIATEHGPVAVEMLQPGMRVMTRDHGLQVLRWTGRSARRAIGRHAPVEFAAGALGDHGRIAVSPNHRVLIASQQAELLFGQPEVLVKAKELVNGGTIRLREDGQSVTYVHLLFDRHEIICGNGLESESYHPGAETLASFDEETSAEVLELMADAGQYGPAARLTLKPHESRLLCSGQNAAAAPQVSPGAG